MSSTDRCPVIFHCYGGTHSSVVAAAIRCRRQLSPYVPQPFWQLPLYDRVPAEVCGMPVPVGVDDQGHDVYVLGRRRLGKWVDTRLRELIEMAGLTPPEIVNAGRQTTVLMKVGGYLSRGMGMERLGRVLLVRGTLQAWDGLRLSAAGDGGVTKAAASGQRVVVILDRGGRWRRCGSWVEVEGDVRVVVTVCPRREGLAETIIRSVVELVDDRERSVVIGGERAWAMLEAGAGGDDLWRMAGGRAGVDAGCSVRDNGGRAGGGG